MKKAQIFCFGVISLLSVYSVVADEVILPPMSRPDIYLPPLATSLVYHEQEVRSKKALKKIEHMVKNAKKDSTIYHEKICAITQQQNNENEFTTLLNDVYKDPELVQTKISLHIKKMSIKKAIEVINKISGMAFVVDPNVDGTIDDAQADDVPIAVALQLLLNSATPRLGLIKTFGVWRVMHYTLVRELLKANAQNAQAIDYVNATHTMQNAKWDDKFKARLEKLWDGVVGDQKGKPGTFIAFDDATKKIFFKSHARQIQDFEAMLQAIDINIPQVRLDVRVIVAEKNFEEMLGFQLSGRYTRNVTSRRLGFAGVGAQPKSDGTSSIPSPFSNVTDWSLNLIPGWKAGDAAISGGMSSLPFIFKNADLTKLLNLTLNAAENRHEIKTILKPSLLVNSEESAEILVGESMPLQTMVAESVGSNISNVTTTQYKDLGIKVNVRPIVSPGSDSVFLDIFLENSSLSVPTITASWQQDGKPQSMGYTIKTTRSKNRVLLRSGQTTLISGLIVNSNDTMKSGVPVLQDIPVLGWFFRGTKKSIEDKQLLIFITPVVV